MLPPKSISADAQERAPAIRGSGLQTGCLGEPREIVRLIPEGPEQLRNFVAELRQVCAGDDGEDDSPVEQERIGVAETFTASNIKSLQPRQVARSWAGLG